MSDPHWHEQNPWKDELLYVPVEELAACWFKPEDAQNSWSMIELISHWTQYGDKLDAYILVGGPVATGGVRFGPEGEHYLSPGFSLPKLHALKQKYLKPQRRPTTYAPGSPGAVSQGCTCPVTDNHNGQGFHGGQFIKATNCPVHTS